MVWRWFSQPRHNLPVTPEVALLGSYAALSNLFFRGPVGSPISHEPYDSDYLCVHQARAIYKVPSTFSPHIPLWENPLRPHLYSLPDTHLQCSNMSLLMGCPLKFSNDRNPCPATWPFVFYNCGMRLRPKVLESDLDECLLTLSVMGKSLSSLYPRLSAVYNVKLTRTYEHWRGDMPDLSEDNWEECVSSYVTSMISARERFIQLRFLHRVYYTPQCLANIYPNLSSLCTRCGTSIGTF